MLQDKTNTLYNNAPNALPETDKHLFGFWVYLMTDLIMFAALFATYAVLRGNTFGGPGGNELFNLPFVFWETMILLASSLTCGLAMLSARDKNQGRTQWFLILTFLLGAAFLAMEVSEFRHLVTEGSGPGRSAFLSAYFTLLGSHGLHIAVGLLWMAVSMVMIRLRGLTAAVTDKLIRLSLFWHFLDIVWIFIFTIVYLMR